MTDKKLLEDLILSYRDYYGTYHHHKERMAYGATALYLAAAAVVASHATEIFKWPVPKDFLIVLLIVSAIAGFAFVWWQLRNRAVGNDIVFACSTVATTLLFTTTLPDVTPTDYRRHSISLPKVLVEALCSHANSRKPLDSPRISEALTYLLMSLWSIAAFLALFRAL